MLNEVWAVMVAIIPSIGVGYLFYRIIKALIEGDRNERLAHSRWEAEHEQDLQVRRTPAGQSGQSAAGADEGTP